MRIRSAVRQGNRMNMVYHFCNIKFPEDEVVTIGLIKEAQICTAKSVKIFKGF